MSTRARRRVVRAQRWSDAMCRYFAHGASAVRGLALLAVALLLLAVTGPNLPCPDDQTAFDALGTGVVICTTKALPANAPAPGDRSNHTPHCPHCLASACHFPFVFTNGPDLTPSTAQFATILLVVRLDRLLGSRSIGNFDATGPPRSI